MMILANLGTELTLPQLMLIAAIVLLTATLLRRLVKRRRSHAPSSGWQGPGPVRPRVADEDAEVRLFEMFRELEGRLNTKIHILNELLMEADVRIARLRALPRSDPTMNGTVPDDPLVVELESALGKTGGEFDARRLKFSEVYRLADEGLSSREICERLHLPGGEVDLLLGIRRRRQQQQALAKPK